MRGNFLKVLAIVLFVLVTSHMIFAQGKSHKGFYLSLQAGPAFGSIIGTPNTGPPLTVTGLAYAFDVQIGGAVKQNVILHANLGMKSIPEPEIEFGMGPYKIDATFDEPFLGGGATMYTKSNYFFTGVLGVGKFSLSSDSDYTIMASTENGFAYQIKIGKEWWVSSHWGLGVVLEYGATHGEYNENLYNETWQSQRFSIRFSATFN